MRRREARGDKRTCFWRHWYGAGALVLLVVGVVTILAGDDGFGPSVRTPRLRRPRSSRGH